MSIQHEDTTSIHRFAFVSNSNPGAVGAFKAWVDTNTNPHILKIRDSGNSSWVQVGELITGSNLGTGASIFKQRNLNNLEFRKIKNATSGLLTVTENTNDVSLAIDQVALEAAGFLKSPSGVLASQITAEDFNGLGNPIDGDKYFLFGYGGDTATPVWPKTEPALITADQNDFNTASNGYFFLWSTDASRNITGLVTDGANLVNVDMESHLIINTGNFNIVLKHLDTGSAATNRFYNQGAVDVTLTPHQAADIIYDANFSGGRWRVYKRN